MRSPDRVRAGLGQTDVADLPFGDQLGQSADGFLDRGARVDPVLVVEVDVVGPEALEGTLDRDADALRAAVGDAGLRPSGRSGRTSWPPPPVTPALDRPADQLLAVERAVDLGGVDVGDAEFERTVDGADRLVVVEPPARV